MLAEAASPSPARDLVRDDVTLSAKTWVVKVGSSVLTGPDGRLDPARIQHLAEEIAAVTATISGLALGGRTVVEDATTTSDLMSSTDSAYLIWKLRQAQKGRIRVGPIERRSGGTSDVKVLPLRMTAAEVAALDEAWRRLGFKSRTALLKKAINALLGPSDDQRPTPSTVEALAIAG